jgi:hypothetical protein
MPTFLPKLPDPLKKKRRITITPNDHVIYGDFSISLMRFKEVIRHPNASTLALILLYQQSALLINECNRLISSLIGLQPPNAFTCACRVYIITHQLCLDRLDQHLLLIREYLRNWFRCLYLLLTVISLVIGSLAAMKLPHSTIKRSRPQ